MATFHLVHVSTVDATHVDLVFQQVSGLGIPTFTFGGNLPCYSCTGGLTFSGSPTIQGPGVIRLTTSPQVSGASYSLTATHGADEPIATGYTAMATATVGFLGFTPPPQNLSFETAGGGAGEAAPWFGAAVQSFSEVCDFANGNPYDDFEAGWSNDTFIFAFAPGDVSAASFTTLSVAPKHQENFEELWSGNEHYLFAIGPTAAPTYGTGDTIEHFEDGWNTVPYLHVFGGGDTSAAVFGSNPFDSFESGWDNDTYLVVFGGGDTTPAGITSGVLLFNQERFEEFHKDTPVTADLTTDKLSATAHGLPNNTPLQVVGDGVFPDPLVPDTFYYVVNTATNDLQLSLTVAGPPIDLTTNGGGDVRLRWDPAKYWVEGMATL